MISPNEEHCMECNGAKCIPRGFNLGAVACELGKNMAVVGAVRAVV